MVEPVSRFSGTSGTQILRPRARILRTFGDELSSSAPVAVIELVKNAYDADATRVLVRFHPSLKTVVHTVWNRIESQRVTHGSFDACI